MFQVNPLLAEDSLETSSLIFSEKQWKIFLNVVCCSRDWRFKGYFFLHVWSTGKYSDQSVCLHKQIRDCDFRITQDSQIFYLHWEDSDLKTG